MLHKSLPLLLVTLLAAAVAFLAGSLAHTQPPVAEPKIRIFELRTYTTEPGKLENLHARFRDHTTKLFEKHGMTNLGYWTPADEPRSQDTLIYFLAHDSREAAAKSWQGFRTDPDWIKARNESETAGPIVKKVESIYLNPVDYSRLK